MVDDPESTATKFVSLRKRAGLSMDALAKAMGYKSASSIQRYERPENFPAGKHFARDLVDKMAKTLVGKGRPPIRSEEVWELADPEFRHIRRLRLVGSFDPDLPTTGGSDAMTVGSETGVRGVPEDGSVQLDLTGGLGAGGIAIVHEGVPGRHGMTFAAEQVRDYWRLPPAILVTLGLSAHDVAIVPVQGDSMLPTINEGDVVFIDTRHRWPSPPGLYAIIDEIGGIVIKRLEVASNPGAEQQLISIISDNPRHGRKEWRAEDVQIVGRVLRKFGVVA